MCKKILIFAGTYEGRKLCEFCTKRKVYADVCVATDYGKEMISPSRHINVLSGRMDEQQIEKLILTNSYKFVIDATHPYASQATENIVSACKKLCKKYIRVLRDENKSDYDGVIFADSIEDAVDYLNDNIGNILVTTGSKELLKYRGLDNLTRLFVRVLPSYESLKACLDFGLSHKNIICMQGPFTKELNIAILRQFNCRFMVTKSSGSAGGFDDKIIAAKEAGADAIIIKRPVQVAGYSLAEIFKILEV